MKSFIAHINENGGIQSVREHSVGTAIIARENLKRIGLDTTGYLAGLLHDCGKYTDAFTEYITKAASGEAVTRGSVIHSFAGASLVLQKFHKGASDCDDVAAEILAFAIGSHHGLFDCIDSDGKSGFNHRLEKQPDIDNEAISNFYEDGLEEKQIESLWKEASNELSSKILQCVNLNKLEDDSETEFYLGLLARLVCAALIDADRKDTFGFMKEKQKDLSDEDYDWNKCLLRIREYLTEFPTETDIQIARKQLSEECEQAGKLPYGIYRLNMPTGAGKTLAGLRFAVAHALENGKRRILYIAPLLSILDQNAQAIRAAVQDDNAILEHHSNILKEDYDKEELELYELMTENWNSPIIITTMVQFLSTLFGGQTTQVRRFNALIDSVIILDEVQSIPAKMLSLFTSAINFLSEICHATIVLCSATQPTFEDNGIPHRLLCNPKEILEARILDRYAGAFKRTQLVDLDSKRIEEMADIAYKLIEDNQSVLIICNKKSEAGAVFEGCRHFPCRCFHLSASMCMDHRRKVLKELKTALDSGDKVLCISTQVIEAGVDVSFEAVVRMTAGLDSIVQAAGRCNRNGERTLSDVYVVNGSNETLTRLEDIQRQKRATQSLLLAYHQAPDRFDNDLAGKEAVEYYYKALYRSLQPGFTEFHWKEGITLYDLLSENEAFRLRGPEYPYLMSQAFKTAGEAFEVIDKSGISVVVHYGNNEALIKALESADRLPATECAALLNRLKPFTIELFEYQKELYDARGALKYYLNDRVAVLDKDYYSSETGLLAGKEDGCNILIL